mgnify:CR=1 FL=1
MKEELLKKIILDKTNSLPLYKQLANALLQQINAGLYLVDEALPSEVEFSSTLQLNHMTVRKALKILEEDGYIYKVRGKGSFVANIKNVFAAKLDESDNQIIGVSMPEVLEDSYLVKTFDSITDYFYQKRFHVIRMSYLDPVDEIRHIEHNSKLLSGIIIQANYTVKHYQTLIEKLKQEKIPVVFAGNLDPEFHVDVDHVKSDDYAGAIKAVDYLAAGGCERVVFATNEKFIERMFERRLGYEAGVARHDLQKKIVTVPSGDMPSPQFDDTDIINLLETPGKLGILAENDSIARTLYNELLARHVKLPEKVELLGFGNDFWGGRYELYEDLPISTVSAPRNAIGWKAAEILHSRMQKSHQQVQTLSLPTKLMHRSTTSGD